MLVTIVQSEVEIAIRNYIRSIMVLQEGVDINISFAATRGDDGLKAHIDIVPVDEQTPVNAPAMPVKRVQVIEEAEPVKATIPRKPRTLGIVAEEPETAPVEQEPETVAETPVTVEEQPEEVVETVAEEEELQPEVVEEAEPVPQKPVGKSLFGDLRKPVNSK